MSDALKRWECPECGRIFGMMPTGPHHEPMRWNQEEATYCAGEPIERTYVAVDALLSAAEPAGWAETLDMGRVGTEAAEAAIRAAVAAVTGEQA